MKIQINSVRLLAVGCLLATVTAVASTTARAAVTTTGNFKTGTPTPTLSITAPFSLTISTSSTVRFLVFDQWVTSDGSEDDANASAAGETLSYRINGGAVQQVGIQSLVDNYAANGGYVTANDALIYLPTGFAVTAGQIVTFLPSSLTFLSGGSTFNSPPAVFTGNAFVTDSGLFQVSNGGSVGTVPEPSAWALLGVGGGMLCWALRQRRARPV